MSELTIRRVAGSDEYPELVAIWRGAVDATHDFISVSDREDIEARLASDYFPAVNLWVAERDGRPIGFAGVVGAKLEMLFVDAAQRGGRVGSALLDHAVGVLGVTEVDVNEQNASAVGFYTRRGFAVVGRRDSDDEGRPYPLLHLRLTP
ncbi:acetyltransferase [Tessaracoccus palaemonis]|uniref:Acetyltransferase n=1 Tax=Tessaracoccus palaemonis TaxID=2829499 RepID=A0ABX8SIJ1_9ACTN|nr:acetyltransferase [Tessaracoccus palaemonis]QXT63113.1 acetyltransferase [Tessaracoccus palaemonis]